MQVKFFHNNRRMKHSTAKRWALSEQPKVEKAVVDCYFADLGRHALSPLTPVFGLTAIMTAYGYSFRILKLPSASTLFIVNPCCCTTLLCHFQFPEIPSLCVKFSMSYGPDWKHVSGATEGLSSNCFRGDSYRFVPDLPITATFTSTSPYKCAFSIWVTHWH